MTAKIASRGFAAKTYNVFISNRNQFRLVEMGKFCGNSRFPNLCLGHGSRSGRLLR